MMKTHLFYLLLLVLFSSTLLEAQNGPVQGRAVDRLDVILEKDQKLLRKALDNLETVRKKDKDLTVQTDDFIQYREALEKLKVNLTPIPAKKEGAEVIGGVQTDFDKFKDGLLTTEIYEQADGTPALTITEGYQKVAYYIVEEDLALNEMELIFYHDQAIRLVSASKSEEAKDAFADSFTSADPTIPSDSQAPLRAATESGKVVRWKPGTTLKYCILKWTFNGDVSRYSSVKKRMADACRDWENTCNIKFEHVESLDGQANGKVFPQAPDGSRQVLFVVGQMDIGETIARSFFPHYNKNKRMLLIDPEEYFSTTIDQTGVLRHELGHILGFRHEHISADKKAWSSEFCNGESIQDSRLITAYDRASVMHYPCKRLLTEGPLKANLELKITELDKSGARSIYGTPDGGAPTGNFSFRDFDAYN